MARLPIVSDKEIIKVLLKKGFKEAPKRGKGSHKAFFRIGLDGKFKLVVVPYNKAIPRGTSMSILNQAGISKEDFINLL